MFAVLVALLAVQPASEHASFQQYPLGLTLEQFRTMRHETARGENIRPMCSNDADRSQFLITLPAQARAGVIDCWVSERIASFQTRASLDLTAEHQGTVSFSFLDGRLYQIEVWADVEALAPIVRGLTEKFGPPAGSSDATLQNAYGAQFPQQTIVWRQSGATIGLVAPAANLRRMVVVYTDTAARQELDRRVAADPSSSARM